MQWVHNYESNGQKCVHVTEDNLNCICSLCCLSALQVQSGLYLYEQHYHWYHRPVFISRGTQ